MPNFDSLRNARVDNLVRRYIETYGRGTRDADTIFKLVNLIAKGLDIEEAREPLYETLVAEACERLAFEVPHFPPPPPIGLSSREQADGDPSEPPNWIGNNHTWPKQGYWARYRRLLLGKFSPEKVDALDQTTDGILKYLGNPKSGKSNWKRYGAVIGQVQSGKTGTFVGLLAKAIDAGYIHIIVLSGLHNNLRSQTQMRIDDGLVGRTNYGGKWKDSGVGSLAGNDSIVSIGDPVVLTTAEDAGDFSKNSRGWTGTDRPSIVVIKKNVKILQRFRAEMESDAETSTPKLSLPAIIIDDEADQASVNSRGIDNPTAINREIRTLMDCYQRASYVGFTATPFANIFMDPDATFEDVLQGKKVPDLYPRDLIRLLQPSAEYFGPRQLLAYESDGPRLTAPADDFAEWLAPKHKKDAQPGPVPESLTMALSTFMVGTAIKRLRKGQKQHSGYDPEMNEHTTMLIHVTRYNDVQARVLEQVHDLFAHAKQELVGGGLDGPWLKRMKAAYQEIRAMGDALLDNLPGDLARWLIGRTYSFEEALTHLRSIINEFQIEIVNGEVEDALRYRDSRERIIIAIGGDKLSRGLTLEGLTVSYYLRNAANWDTLMQMGRWFGYRERYLDLCRVYMPGDLEAAYEEVLEALVDLEDQLVKAEISGSEPLDFCLVLMGSAYGKMPTGKMPDKKTYLVGGYGGQLTQKRIIPIDEGSERLVLARQALDNLLKGISIEPTSNASGTRENLLVFREVPAKYVHDFIETIDLPRSGNEEETAGVIKYLKDHAAEGRLVNWTVAIPSVRKYPAWDPYEDIEVGGFKIGPSRRANQAGNGKVDGLDGFRRTVTLIGPVHEGAGLTEKQLRDAQVDPSKTLELMEPRDFRKARLVDGQPTEGLLLVYPVVNAKKDASDTQSHKHGWSVAWAMSLPPIGEDVKKRVYVPIATDNAWKRTNALIKEDLEESEDV